MFFFFAFSFLLPSFIKFSRSVHLSSYVLSLISVQGKSSYMSENSKILKMRPNGRNCQSDKHFLFLYFLVVTCLCLSLLFVSVHHELFLSLCFVPVNASYIFLCFFVFCSCQLTLSFVFILCSCYLTLYFLLPWVFLLSLKDEVSSFCILYLCC